MVQSSCGSRTRPLSHRRSATRHVVQKLPRPPSTSVDYQKCVSFIKDMVRAIYQPPPPALDQPRSSGSQCLPPLPLRKTTSQHCLCFGSISNIAIWRRNIGHFSETQRSQAPLFFLKKKTSFLGSTFGPLLLPNLISCSDLKL